MKIFESARVRLTAWYLLIIAFICVSFSAIIYQDVSWELERGFLVAEARLQGHPLPIGPKTRVLTLLQEELIDAKKALLLRLILVNSIILLVSGVGGYFLAGKTLKPIEDAMDEQKRFVADASHELKTPLTSLKTEIEVGLRDKNLKLKSAKELLKSNLEDVNKIKNLTDYLLSLSRYEAEQKGLLKEEVDLGEVARQAVSKNQSIAKKRKIQIKTNFSEVLVWGNPASLVELVSIFLNNAIKYSQAGKEVFVNVKKVGRKAQVAVIDQGMGISSDDLPHIFDRFYRSDVSRNKEKVDGFGLGLSIAKSIAEAHKGIIGVKSSVGVGSTFIVSFPSVSA